MCDSVGGKPSGQGNSSRSELEELKEAPVEAPGSDSAKEGTFPSFPFLGGCHALGSGREKFRMSGV